MGAWGAHAFENDTASDWLLDAFEQNLVNAVKLALNVVADAPATEYLEVDIGVVGLAAAEVVAIAFGRAREGYTDPERLGHIARYAEEIRSTPDIRSLALASITRIEGPNSELAELWNEGSSTRVDWSNENADLRSRLS
jgi:hypothetical protein